MESLDNRGPRRYGFWQALGYSFYSRELYRDVKENWKGTGLGLLFLVWAMIGIPRAVQFQFMLGAHLPGFTAKIPGFSLAKGVFSASVPQPYRIDFPGGCVVIDTTGKIKAIDQVPGEAELKELALVTKTGYFTRQVRAGNVRDESHLFKPQFNFSVTQAEISKWTAAAVGWSGAAFCVFWIFVGIPLEAFAVLIYALVGVLFAEVTNRDLNYGDALRLASVSHVPGLFFFNALIPAGLHLPFPVFWSFLVSVGYVCFAVSAVGKRTTEPT